MSMRRGIQGIAAVVLIVGIASSAEAGQGWYLMLPPRSEYNVNADFLQGYKIRSSEPLSRWGQQGAYNSAAECEAAKSLLMRVEHSYYEKTSQDYLKAVGSNTDPVVLRLQRFLTENANANVDMYQASRCIASDDPRLVR